jgi:hypothetical protein
MRAGYPFRSGIPLDPDGTVSVIQGRDVDATRLRIVSSAAAMAHIAASGIRNLAEHTLDAADVILMARGPRNYAVPVGHPLPHPCIVAGSFHVLRPDEKRVIPAFLAWLLNQECAQTFMRINNSGTTIPMITLDMLRALPVRLPPLAVQRHVAELNALVEHERNLMAQLTTARRNLLRGWANAHTSHA